jgi:hypothetical protein
LALPGALTPGLPAPPEALTLTTRELPDALETRVHWAPQLQDNAVIEQRPGASLVLDAVSRAHFSDPSQSVVSVDGELKNVKVKLIGGIAEFVHIDVDRLAFAARTGEKTSMDVDLGEIVFLPPLSFIEELKKYLSFGDDTFSIDISPTDITLALNLPLPNITVGVFALTNLSFDAGLNIPILGDPARLRFGFCTRENPFHITVMCIGGGGWVTLGLGLDGFEWLEIGFEAGAELALDFGVASGSVHIFLGITFMLEEIPQGTKITLTGYLRVGGEVDVLGLISASIELRLELQYLNKPLGGGNSLDIMHGRATLVVEVDVLVFSGSVEIECEKSFGGDPADPTFADWVTADEWQTYCDAFAPAGV